MSRTYASDYTWQLKYQPPVRTILSDTFAIGPADVTFTSPESADDRHFNTDALVMVDGRVRRVALRLRNYLVGDEFTLRYLRPDSATEWQKLFRGFGDYFFYGRGTQRLTVEDWFVGDLSVLRRWVDSFLRRGEEPPHVVKTNKDGSSSFVAFSRSSLPAEFTIAEDRTGPDMRECAWTIVRNTRDLTSTGHERSVRWARAVLEFDSETSA